MTKIFLLGMGTAFILTGLYWLGYTMGRESIAHECEEFRAFRFDDDAWGCVRLKKRRGVESDIVNRHERVNL